MKNNDTNIFGAFNSVRGINGKKFGQNGKEYHGISDDENGVQWNLSIWKDTGDVQLGVNLEGKKYKNWPIAVFISSELKSPTICTLTTNSNLNDVSVRFSRDAWQQKGSRPEIVEEYIGGKEFHIYKIDTVLWESLLEEALACLDKEKNYRGRAKQLVTLKKNNKQINSYVSPHLTIWTPISNDNKITDNLKKGIEKLQPVYDWVCENVRV